jgi:predicted nucleic acid-binding protein
LATGRDAGVSGVVLNAGTKFEYELSVEDVALVRELWAGPWPDQAGSVNLTELIHGLYRAQTPEMRVRRESFLHELLVDLTVYPYTKETAMLAGKIDGEQQSQGVVIPFGDLLIGATALSLGFQC